MILLMAVLTGALAGLVRAWWGRREFDRHLLGHLELLAAATLLQGVAFFFPLTRSRIPDQLAAFFLVLSQFCLLLFVWLNRAEPGCHVLGVGLAANLLVIVANGGLMPLSPEIAAQLSSPSQWQLGERYGWSKDIVLPQADTHLGWLADRFLFPAWFPRRCAFSLGDVAIALGAFWSLWVRGRTQGHGRCKVADSERRGAIRARKAASLTE